jgi:hypothetical protein
MNVQLTQVLSDITGVTGLAIIRAIVAGERDPLVLAQLRNPRCKSSQDEIAKALTGHYRAEHLFGLEQALGLYDFYSAQIAACDRVLEQQYAALRPVWDEADPPPPLGPDRKRNSHSKNAPGFDVRQKLYDVLGVDLTDVDGLDDSTAQVIVSEIGSDMSKWPTEKHFCSWLGLAPHNDITGGRVIRSRTLKVRNRAAQALRMAAQSVGRTDTAVGAFYRRLRARIGHRQALTATAHKIARIVYQMLKHHQPYQALARQEYEQQQRERELKALQRKAAKLGLSLVPRPMPS